MQFLRESVISAFLSQIDDFVLIRSTPTGALVSSTTSAHRMCVGIVHKIALKFSIFYTESWVPLGLSRRPEPWMRSIYVCCVQLRCFSGKNTFLERKMENAKKAIETESSRYSVFQNRLNSRFVVLE